MNVIAVTGRAGDVMRQQFLYSPFGIEAQGDLSGNPYRYTGRYFDAETGLFFYRARYYNPDLGRFLNVDPIGYADQWNLYAYVGNDPLNATDPSGMYSCSTINEIRIDKMHYFELDREMYDHDIGVQCRNVRVKIDPVSIKVPFSDNFISHGFIGLLQEDCLFIDGNAIKSVFINRRHAGDAREILDVRTNVVVYQVDQNYLSTDRQISHSPNLLLNVGVGVIEPID